LKAIWAWSIAGVVLIVVILLSIAFIDKPAALASYRLFGDSPVFRRFTHTPSFYLLGLFAIPIAIALRYVVGFRGKMDRVLIQCAASLALTRLCLAPLKILFGRTWPVFSHPSLIRDGAFGFNFFHRGESFASFPSGHTAAVCAILGILWVTYPRYRPYYFGVVALLSLGLILGDFHFVSDVIAGAFLGAIVSAFVLNVSMRIAHQSGGETSPR
jgi:membrane-associated phospholipid phosphatase